MDIEMFVVTKSQFMSSFGIQSPNNYCKGYQGSSMGFMKRCQQHARCNRMNCFIHMLSYFSCLVCHYYIKLYAQYHICFKLCLVMFFLKFYIQLSPHANRSLQLHIAAANCDDTMLFPPSQNFFSIFLSLFNLSVLSS